MSTPKPVMEKPLFIPLKRTHYNAFVEGRKTTEYRRAGGRWNAKTCRVGRQVVLSMGYGKARRRTGTITAFTIAYVEDDAFIECYGQNGIMAACIMIQLDGASQ